MALVVQKFGGTSVGSIDRIRNVARRCLAAQRAGNDVVVIVSAMSGETNRLLGLAHQVAEVPDAREMDAIAATGEQTCAALTAMAIHAEGGSARSLLGHQVRILTDGAFTKARIKTIDGSKIFETLKAGQIAVVAGFQGVDEHGNITTLGRGGRTRRPSRWRRPSGPARARSTPTSTASTRPTPTSARRRGRSTASRSKRCSSWRRSAQSPSDSERGDRHEVRSSHSRAHLVLRRAGHVGHGRGRGARRGRGRRRGVRQERSARSHRGPGRQAGVSARLFTAIAEKNVSVDMIIQNVTRDEARADVTFTVSKTDLQRVKTFIEETARSLGAREVRYDEDIAKISIVGLGMRSHAGVAAKMFQILADEQINIQAIATSEIKISCLVAAKYGELAVRVLHDGFGLGDKPEAKP